jgi:hypothetical protein
MTCEECGNLQTHGFRGPEDLVHAVQTAAQESDRGVLRRVEWRDLAAHERVALDSAFESGHVPGIIRYRFECTSCGDTFELVADTSSGEGSWRRGDEPVKARRP